MFPSFFLSSKPSSQRGFDFTTPYFYAGLQFAGLSQFVECAESISTTDDCTDTVICILDGSTHVDVVQNRNPSSQIVSVASSTQMHLRFIEGRCNVVAGEQATISELAIREAGYTGTDYVVGSLVLSKEPLAIVTRNDDAQWSDFVKWVVQATLTAEEEGILQRTAGLLQLTGAFGTDFQHVFAASVKAIGNYAEMYRRNLEAIAPRQIGNTVNLGASGLVYAFPFGDMNGTGPGPVIGGMMERVLQRGHVKCGVSKRAIFAMYDNKTDEWNGFDVDFCKALSAALFDGDMDKVEYTDLSSSTRFVALAAGDVDVLSRITTHTFERDVLEPASGVGFFFSRPNFYDGMTFGGVPNFVECADRQDITSASCRDLRICVEIDTTFESIMKNLFQTQFVVPVESEPSTFTGLTSGICNVIAGGVGDVAISVARLLGYQGDYQVGGNRYSKDPLALVTRQDDPQWTSFVNWLVDATFFAEEQGITKETGGDMPQVRLFGEAFLEMFRNVISAVGSYGEIYERSVQDEVRRGGLNLLNTQLSGPQHYPLPGVV